MPAVLKPINLLTDNGKIDRQLSIPSAGRSAGCVDIASSSVLHVAQWTWYVHAVTGSGQTGRTSGKFYLC